MKIAILMAGHIRFWERCRDNFMNCIYQPNNKIDVFVDTYNRKFRSDYAVRGECHTFNPILNSSQIISMFDNINLVSFQVEPEVPYHPTNQPAPQARKLKKIYDTFNDYQEKNGKYDLVIKSRFDILLEHPLNYEYILDHCSPEKKTIFISNGVVNCIPSDNDMFAISTQETFHYYGYRHHEFPETICPHTTIRMMRDKHKISCIPCINIKICRFSHDGETIVEER